MSKLELTRYLYFKDEVVLSFVLSILKNNLDSAYFWFSELFYSKYDVNRILFKIFYDFYYVYNSEFEKYLLKKITHDESQIKDYITIIKNLVKLRKSPYVFLNRQKPTDKLSFKGRPSKILEKIDKPFKLLFQCIEKNKLNYFYKLLTKLDITDQEYFLKQFKYFDNRLIFIQSSFKHYDFKHILLAYLTKFKLDIYSEKNKRLYLLSCDDEINYVLKTNDPIPPRDFVDKNGKIHKINRVRETLKIHRLYSIDQDISAFNFKRKHLEKKTVFDKVYYNWEYYLGCDLWKERLEKFNAWFDFSKNDDQNYIRFPNDELLEDFYENYGYEPDEQSIETQEKSISTINRNVSAHGLLTSLFSECIDFNVILNY